MTAKEESKQKKVEIVFSERRDSWTEEFLFGENDTLQDVLIQRGFNQFIVAGVDRHNPEAIYDGMIIRVKIIS